MTELKEAIDEKWDKDYFDEDGRIKNGAYVEVHRLTKLGEWAEQHGIPALELAGPWLREGGKGHRYNGNFYDAAKKCESALAALPTEATKAQKQEGAES